MKFEKGMKFREGEYEALLALVLVCAVILADAVLGTRMSPPTTIAYVFVWVLAIRRERGL